MRKHRIVRHICLLMTLTALVGTAPALAASLPQTAENSIQYIGTISTQAGLYFGNGTAGCQSSMVLVNGYDANLTMFLQQKTSSGQWRMINAWRASGSGITGVSCSGSQANLTAGASYRVYCSAYVYRNGVYVEHITWYSAEQTY